MLHVMSQAMIIRCQMKAADLKEMIYHYKVWHQLRLKYKLSRQLTINKCYRNTKNFPLAHIRDRPDHDIIFLYLK